MPERSHEADAEGVVKKNVGLFLQKCCLIYFDTSTDEAHPTNLGIYIKQVDKTKWFK